MYFRAADNFPYVETEIAPRILVFGVYPKICGEGCRGAMHESTNIIRENFQVVLKLKTERAIFSAARTSNTPSLVYFQTVGLLPRAILF